MNISGLHKFDNFTNNGQTTVSPRTFNADGTPARMVLMDLDEIDLEDLAQFQNFSNQAGGNASFQGTHSIKNITNAKKGNVNFLDHKGGQFVTVANANNMGNMNVSGLHQFKNTQNSGNFVAAPRTFNADGTPASLMILNEEDLEDLQEYDLEDLASFQNFANQAGGNASFQGTHSIQNITNAKKGNVRFLDHKGGQFVTVANANNMGNMNVSGLHQFKNTQNSGNFVAAPRTFNADGTPASLMVLDEEDLENLAQFSNFGNQAGGNA